jgi:sterol desaturase/sphingolipid hydroxylase (fatty acid hydroxylase superfamily)
MHLAPLFKTVHAGHHRSITPTPWAILSFQPLETISQFGFFALVIFFVPLHPATVLAYLLFDGIVNAAGHCGHEFVPQSSQKHWLLKYLNAVTHHDLHHTRLRYNFGQYFNIWDRLFGTFLDRPVAAANRPCAPRRRVLPVKRNGSADRPVAGGARTTGGRCAIVVAGEDQKSDLRRKTPPGM